MDSKGMGIGVRIPSENDQLLKNLFITTMLKRIDQPIVSTSFNISGGREIDNPGDDTTLIGSVKEIELVIDAGEIKGEHSRIFDIRDINNIKIIR
jgi:tRNA A37 threonylcarbamoyladenosine synthetase subunit TsaC/SUA5/YrdC